MPYLSGSTNRRRMLNIGLSTSINYKRTLLSSELELVSGESYSHVIMFLVCLSKTLASWNCLIIGEVEAFSVVNHESS